MRRTKVNPENYFSDDDETGDGLFNFLRTKFGKTENEVLKWISVEDKAFIEKRYKDTSFIDFKDRSKPRIKTIQSSMHGQDSGYLIIGTTVTKSIVSRQYNNKNKLALKEKKTRASQSQSASSKKNPTLDSSDKPNELDVKSKQISNDIYAYRSDWNAESTKRLVDAGCELSKAEPANRRRRCVIA